LYAQQEKGGLAMSKALKNTFLIHAIVCIVSGLLLLIIPGRTLLFFRWAPIDPILTRVLGAALLALGWSSFRGWQATERAQVQIVLEMEAVFTALACVGLLRHLLFAHYPLVVWLLFAVYLIFAVAWIAALVRRE
jgi:hypothetical protein